MAQHDSKGVSEAAAEPKPTRRRDRLLPAMVERQAQGRIAASARNILAKHRHAVADIGPSSAHRESAAEDKRRSDRGDQNIERIRSTQ